MIARMALPASGRYTRRIVTSGNELITPSPSEIAKAAPRASSRQRWSRRRSVSSVFALIAVAGLAAATIAPTGVAMAEQASAEPAPVSLYASTISDAQSLLIASETPVTGLSRGSYTVYVAPKPTPTPEPVAAASSESESSSGGSSAGPLYYTGGGSAAEWMAAAGIAEGDWGYVDYIVSRESGWNPNATNSSSGACGLVQALPCSKVPGNGYDPVDNLRWANGYATGRYGSWAGAYSFWVNNHWW